jgi:FixJ family two-component response regulator
VSTTFQTLSDRELAELRALCAGQADRAIAARLGLHRRTVDRLLSGRPSYPGTIALARLALSLAEKPESTP